MPTMIIMAYANTNACLKPSAKSAYVTLALSGDLTVASTTARPPPSQVSKTIKFCRRNRHLLYFCGGPVYVTPDRIK